MIATIKIKEVGHHTRVSGQTSGFTIVELLVAMTVTVILSGLMIAMTAGVLRAWGQTTGTLGTNNQARQVFSLLHEDLQSALFRYAEGESPTDVWFAVDVLDRQNPDGFRTYDETHFRNDRRWVTTGTPASRSPHSETMKPDGSSAQGGDRTLDLATLNIADSRFGFGGVWLRFFKQNPNGTISAVSYQIVRRHIIGDQTGSPPNQAEVQYMLTRTVIGAEPTLENAVLDDGYDIVSINYLDPPSGQNSPGLVRPVESNPDVIADHVIDFGVRLYEQDEFGNLELLFPTPDANGNPTNDEYVYFATGGSAQPFPNVIDIKLRVLTDEGARQIRLLESGQTRVPSGVNVNHLWWDIAEANSRVFTQRIFVNASPFY